MHESLPPILEDAGIHARTPQPLGPRRNVWLVDVHGTPAVLRLVTHVGLESIRWEQEFLHALTMRGFPAPRPITAFGGYSWVETNGAVWKLNEYLKGEPLGWRAQPSLQEVGRFIAHYHDVVATIAMKPRPGFVPLCDYILDADPIMVERALGPDATKVFWVEARRISSQLQDAGDMDKSPIVVHGDLHCDNILVAGEPPTFSGVIDFGSANHEPALVDLGFSIWRTGRSDPVDTTWDLERIANLAAGYLAARTVPRNQVLLLPTYLVARGLVLITLFSGRGLTTECQVALQRVRWLLAHLDQVADTIGDPGVPRS
jgi:Ser/Thr protein kinase RdoA (MazF antagonist)